ncbi:pirin family protein [Methanolobus chelungpuianus]|nr:pirin family protein [Methanolobus chelungpuianus]
MDSNRDNPSGNISGNTSNVRQMLKSVPITEGAGVHLRRAFTLSKAAEVDPFLMLDEFHSRDPEDYRMGFPWHPHRGMETITYVLSGVIEHGDSLGNRGTIGPGDIQWMTAGSGIIHQEMPKGNDNGELWGLQLWTNLPASHKMMPPRYREIKKDQIPLVHTMNGTEIKVICGEVDGMRGPVKDIMTEIEYLDVTIPADASYRHPTQPSDTVLAYVLEGEGYFDPSGSSAGSGNLIVFDSDYWTEIKAGDKGLRYLLLSGKPLDEPVAWRGPVVMNTEEELRQAFEEYRENRFVKEDVRFTESSG